MHDASYTRDKPINIMHIIIKSYATCEIRTVTLFSGQQVLNEADENNKLELLSLLNVAMYVAMCA